MLLRIVNLLDYGDDNDDDGGGGNGGDGGGSASQLLWMRTIAIKQIITAVGCHSRMA